MMRLPYLKKTHFILVFMVINLLCVVNLVFRVNSQEKVQARQPITRSEQLELKDELQPLRRKMAEVINHNEDKGQSKLPEVKSKPNKSRGKTIKERLLDKLKKKSVVSGNNHEEQADTDLDHDLPQEQNEYPEDPYGDYISEDASPDDSNPNYAVHFPDRKDKDYYLVKHFKAGEKEEAKKTLTKHLRGFGSILRRARAYRRPAFIPFTYDKSSRGPLNNLVEGWPPSADRNISRYISPSWNNFLLEPETEPKRDVIFLVTVHSAPSSFHAREGIRKSWGNTKDLLYYGAKLVFLLGTTSNVEVMKKVHMENEKNKDILLADFKDHYNNLTLKTVFTLKFFLYESWWKLSQPPAPQYLFKLDDDAYLNFRALEEIIVKISEAEDYKEEFILGKAFGLNNRPIEPIRPPKRRKSGSTKKWWTPPYMYNGHEYPLMVSGAGYLMSRPAANCLYREVLKLPYFHLEDVLVTGFARQACRIRIEHSGAFVTNPSRLGEIHDATIMIHYVGSAAKNKLHKIAVFDELQEKYLQLLNMTYPEEVAGETRIPVNTYFERIESEDEREREKEKLEAN